MKRLAAAWLGALAACSAPAAERPPETRAEQRAVSGIVAALEGKDCALAVDRLNSGLAARHPGVFLMAGTMYEEGLCLKPNWERAVQMYTRAIETGHPGGRYKLAAGHAQAGRDVAAALWWAHQGQGAALPPECRLPADSVNEPETFVAGLRAWPRSRVDACVYAVGVLATVAGDAEYPPDALDFSLAGKVQMTFTPADGRIVWATLEVEAQPPAGVVSSDLLQDRASRTARRSLQRYLESAGDRALRRFRKPEGIDPAWKVQTVYEFSLSN